MLGLGVMLVGDLLRTFSTVPLRGALLLRPSRVFVRDLPRVLGALLLGGLELLGLLPPRADRRYGQTSQCCQCFLGLALEFLDARSTGAGRCIRCDNSRDLDGWVPGLRSSKSGRRDQAVAHTGFCGPYRWPC
jgi:hypothetical protein